MIYQLPYILIRCLVITIILETVGAYIFKIKEKHDLINVILINVLTNPILVLIVSLCYFRYGICYYYASIIFLELLVVFVEGLFYSMVLFNKKINSYLLSFILNGISYFIGFLIQIVI